MKGYHLSIEGIQRGTFFVKKKAYKRVRGWTSGRSTPYKNLLSNLLPPPPATVLDGSIVLFPLMYGDILHAGRIPVMDYSRFTRMEWKSKLLSLQTHRKLGKSQNAPFSDLTGLKRTLFKDIQMEKN